MNLSADEFSFQICTCVSPFCTGRAHMCIQCSCFPVRMEPSGGIEAFEEAALESVWRAAGGPGASPIGAEVGAGRIGIVEVMFAGTKMRD
jgi:hypothetical protein